MTPSDTHTGAAVPPAATPAAQAPAAAAPAVAAPAAGLPLLQQGDPAALATHYVPEAGRAANAQPGASCASCGLFGAVSASEGTCALFPGKLVLAAGWCSAWSRL
ncbi:MAG TPA: high-potential iron-sulfur protein [Steroidobacteraceae bacterium]|nr:high-potential iron-sulfur protein [Steroidobacteraceae bacterium]